jgi:hypothetical protein
LSGTEGAEYTAVILPTSGAQLYRDTRGQTQLSLGADNTTNSSVELQTIRRRIGKYGEMLNGFLIFVAAAEAGQPWTPKMFSTKMIWRPHQEVGIAALASRNPKGH